MQLALPFQLRSPFTSRKRAPAALDGCRLIYDAQNTQARAGNSPSGTMMVELSSPDQNTIEITYDIPSGIQAFHHANPGKVYTGTTRVANLPNNDEGRQLLTRLKDAWKHGLTFNIGTSLSTGESDVVIWSKIPHKTSLHGGPFGWPDPHYFTACNASLDGLQVPNDNHTDSMECISYFAPKSMTTSDAISSCLRAPPTASMDGECAICFDSLGHGHGRLEMIQGCNHVFHGHCIERCLSVQPTCPMCRQPVGEPQGRSPSGTMSIKLTKKAFPGDEKVKAISIVYHIPSGIQLSYHENPGAAYEGATREAYLPYSADGRRLLARLKYAWTHGLIFRVGTSLTTGQHNVVTWTSIHHKTCLNGGLHGFPDANYITNCNGSLDALFVPDAGFLV